MRIAGLIIAGSAAMLTSSAAFGQAETGDPSANWGAIAQCAQADSPSDRHNCMDDVLRQTGLLDPQVEIAQQRDTFGQQPSYASEDRNAQQIKQEDTRDWAPPPTVDRVESTIAYAKLNERGTLIVVTEEGAVWKQTGGDKVYSPPNSGLAFEAKLASMGSFKCKVGKYTVFRCERLD